MKAVYALFFASAVLAMGLSRCSEAPGMKAVSGPAELPSSASADDEGTTAF